MIQEEASLSRPAMARDSLAVLLLLCAVSANLRSILLAVPPALPGIRAEFGLSFAAAGALTALPVAVMGAMSLPGATLVNRFGPRRVLGFAILALGVSSLFRIAPPQLLNLYFWTAVLAACISVAQPALAVIARSWFPHNVQGATTAYSAALNTGAVAGATLSVYAIALAGWPATFVAWSAAALAAGGAWFLLAPHVPPQHEKVAPLADAVRNGTLWRVALILGCQSLIYYGASTWTPFHLRSSPHSYVSLVLLLLTGTTIPVGIFLAGLKVRWASSRVFYAITGALAVAGSAGMLFTGPSIAWFWAIFLGTALGMGFSGAMSMPNLLAPTRAHVATYSALALSVAYAMALIGPLVGGVLVDRTGSAAAPFWLTMSAGAVIAVTGVSLRAAPAGQKAAG